MAPSFRAIFLVLMAWVSVISNAQHQLSWLKTYNSASARAYKIALDLNGSAYVACVLGNRAALLKYSSHGQHQWTYVAPQVHQFELLTHPVGLSLDSSGNPVMFIATGVSPGADDFQVVKCDASGNEVWTRVVDLGSKDELTSGALDSLGNAYAIGFNGGPSKRAFIVKVSSIGDIEWTRSFDLPNTHAERFHSIAVDADDRPIVGGFSSFGLALNGGLLLVRYTADGNIESQWKDTVDVGTQYSLKVQVDSQNRVVLMGTAAEHLVSIYRFEGSLVPSMTIHHTSTNYAPFVDFTIDSEGSLIVLGYDRFAPVSTDLLKYSEDGVFQWSETFGGYSTRVVVDSLGRIFVHGALSDWVSDVEVGVVAFDGTGSFLWADSYDGDDEVGTFLGDLAITSSDEVVYAATDDEDLDGVDIVIAKYAEPQHAAADLLTIIFGFVTDGALLDTVVSDDAYLELRGDPTLSRNDPPLMFEVEATAHTETPFSLKFAVESRVDSQNIGQRIEMFNYVTNQYEVVSTTLTPIEDGTVEVLIDSNASRFVEPGTKKMKTRLAYYHAGPVFVRTWRVKIDLLRWTVMP